MPNSRQFTIPAYPTSQTERKPASEPLVRSAAPIKIVQVELTETEINLAILALQDDTWSDLDKPQVDALIAKLEAAERC